MLTHLVIRNFAIISTLEVPFRSGLTVLSGETGAGKSIVIEALNLLLGGRASTDVIRTEEPEAVVEGIFQLDDGHRGRVEALLEEQGIEPGGDQLVVRRIVSRGGRNKVFINGSLSTVTALGELTDRLVDISGQHEHYSLMRSDRHLDILDAFGELEEEREKMKDLFGRVRELRAELEQLRQDDSDRLNRIDFLRFQLDEIDAAELQPGEEDELRGEFERLKHAEKITDATRRASALCYEDEGSAVERLAEAAGALRRVAEYDDQLEVLLERLEEARFAVEDAAHELLHVTDDIDDDPARLDRIQERLEQIKRLTRKHGGDLQTLLEHAREMREELQSLENAEERGDEIDAELQRAEASALSFAVELSEQRREVAGRFSAEIVDELEQLHMSGTQFIVDFRSGETANGEEAASELGARGIDTVEFLIAPNVGEEPKPLTRIASGGELSRIMLAIKTVLRERDDISTYVFDEVDSGVGGSTADRVGEKIRDTADAHQVLCITHLPQIASRGDHHYMVEKALVEGRTQSTIRPLDDEERVAELARMLGGTRVTDKTLDAARELLGTR